MICPLIHRPCGCRVRSLREVPWNLSTWAKARLHGRPYYNWDGFHDEA